MTPTNETAVPDLIADLHRSDEETGGQPVLSPDRVGTARAYLEQLLLDATDRLQQHIAALEKLYRARFVAPLPRSWRQGSSLPAQPPAVGFRHAGVLEEPLAMTVLEAGVDRLPPGDLARLLLNPRALWDLTDLINTLLPDYWLDRMEEQGVQWAKDSGIDLYEGFASAVGTEEAEDSRLATSTKERATWKQLLEVLQRCVPAGQVTTYGECSQWAFGSRKGGNAIVAMLNAMAKRGYQRWSNRVVQDDGGIADPPEQGYGQRAQLQAEGIPVDAQGHVNRAACPRVVLR
jgi:alkylated DNA nucleotide flippase Atl1